MKIRGFYLISRKGVNDPIVGDMDDEDGYRKSQLVLIKYLSENRITGFTLNAWKKEVPSSTIVKNSAVVDTGLIKALTNSGYLATKIGDVNECWVKYSFTKE